jgi:hypothetical protein
MRFFTGSLLLSAAAVTLALPEGLLPRQDTGSCVNTRQCRDPTKLDRASQKYCNTVTHQCEPRFDNGEQCTSHDACKGVCVSGFCKSDFTGESCEAATDCGPTGRGYLCSPITKTCLLSERYKGLPCVESEQCVTGYCSKSSGLCDHKPGAEFADCSSNADCTAPNVCRKTQFHDTKTCQATDGTLYSPCSAEKKCVGKLQCTNGECSQPPECTERGLACSKNANCCSGKCSTTGLFFLWQCE